MEENRNESIRPVQSRRRKRTKLDIFKEHYLPMLIAVLAVIMILVIIIGSITRAVQRKQVAQEASIAAAEEQARQFDEARSIEAAAEQLAQQYDYAGAIALIDGFSGDITAFPELTDLRAEYVTAESRMVTWDDPGSIPNLSFHTLVVDGNRAFSNAEYGNSNLNHYITTTEFENILQQLYANGYTLVSLDDFITTTVDDYGEEIYQTQSVRLPDGKKPLILTQTNVNYYTYLVDGDGDDIADKDGLGFASRMVVGADGKVDCEYITADGQTLTGAYDLVPILDDFIDEHPDFSYQGAKATIAVTGYDGVFGYRTNAGAEETLGADAYAQQIAAAKDIAQALTNSGYTLACYTYNNIAYGNSDASIIQTDLSLWNTEVTPIIGNVDTLVFAQSSDISDGTSYMGDKFNVLHNAGFRYFLGFCSDGAPWASVMDDYVRQGRILVGGSSLTENPASFTDLFDAAAILDTAARGTE